MKIPEAAHQLLRVYKVFWPPEYKIKFGANGEFMLKDINLDPPPKTVQTKLVQLDAEKRSEYNHKRQDNLA